MSITASGGSGSTEQPTAIATGDFDNDAKQDVVFTKHDRTSPYAGSLVFLRNTSSGAGSLALATAMSFSVGHKPSALTVGDFNSDSKLDVAVASLNDSSVTVLLGDGAGSFSAAPGSPLALAAPPTAILAAHMDGGSNLDLVVATDRTGNDDRIYVALGQGNGSFGSPASYAAVPGSGTTDAQPKSLAIGEYNEDGLADVAIANYHANSVTALLSTTQNPGTLTGPTTLISNFNQPVGLLAAQFDTQYQDVLYLPTTSAVDPGRNVGHGIEIVEYPPASGRHYAFLTNYNQDTGPGPCNAGPTAGADPAEPGNYIANTVTVVKINPQQFAPTAQLTANDTVAALLEVGCGPQGIAASSDGSKVFVANAYEGSVSRIDVGSLVTAIEGGSLDPTVPTDDYTDARFDILPASHPSFGTYPAPLGAVSTRGLAYLADEALPGVSERLFVALTWPSTVNQHDGMVAIVKDPSTAANGTDPEAWVGGVTTPSGAARIGRTPVGIKLLARDGAPVQVTSRDPGTNCPLGSGVRLVVVSNDRADVASHNTASFVDLHFASDVPTAYITDQHALSKDCPIAAPTDARCKGTVSGQMAVSADGNRVYVAREADSGGTNGRLSTSGVVVVDANPSGFPAFMSQRVLGSVGRTEGVFSVARIPLSSTDVSSGKNHKLYVGNSDPTASPTDYRGTYLMPEPLVIPFHSFEIRNGTLDAGFEFPGGNTLRIGTRETLIRSASIRGGSVEPKLTYSLQSFDGSFGGIGIFSPVTSRVAVANLDGSNARYLTGVDEAADLPSWVTTGGANNSDWILFAKPNPTSGRSDIYIVDATNPASIPCNLSAAVPGGGNGDPRGYQNGSAIDIVFTHDEGTQTCASNPNKSADFQAVWRTQYTIGPGCAQQTAVPTRLTAPWSDLGAEVQVDCDSYQPGEPRLGDYDPDPSPPDMPVDQLGATTWVVFARRFDVEDVAPSVCGDDRFGNHDILIQRLDDPLSASLANLTRRDDGPSGPCSGPTDLCADQIPRWSTTAMNRIAFTSFSGNFDTTQSDIVTIVPTLGPSYVRTDADPTSSGNPGDLQWDMSPIWYPNPQEGDANPDLLLTRFSAELPVSPSQVFGLFHSSP